MPFRARFDCLWCGRTWQTRSQDDLEGWATLCPQCLGRADHNGFLRDRLRAGLRERAAVASGPATAAAPAAVTPGPGPATTADMPAALMPGPGPTVGPSDDWYLRRGRFTGGPLYDGPWQMELDEAISWLDRLPMRGTLVELGAGTGWWSALLSGKGELWCYEADELALEAARRRLVAHGRLAHLHLRDPLVPAERAADVVFAAFLLGGANDRHGLLERLAAVASWLRPGGEFAFIEVAPGAAEPPVDGPAGPLWPRTVEEIQDALSDARFDPLELRSTHRAFVLGHARRAERLGS